jgi:RNA polymerase sigma factor (sigma-70 family)
MQATDLVHEVYFPLVRYLAGNPCDLQNSTHFYALVSRMMRHRVYDDARRKLAYRKALDEANLRPPTGTDSFTIIKFEAALAELQKLDARQRDALELALFTPASTAEIAELIGVRARTIDRYIEHAARLVQAALEYL